MSGKIHHNDEEQEPFAFTEANLSQARTIIARYPAGMQQSALMPLLMLAQQQNNGHLSKPAMDYIADVLGMAPVRVYEVATFYTMYNLDPVGNHVIEVCTTTPCWLRGSDAIIAACERRLNMQVGNTTVDGQFTVREAECLGACVNAPMCQIRNSGGSHYYEDLTPDAMIRIIDTLDRGEQPKPGPQNGRHSSEPDGGLTSLKEVG